MENSTDCVGNYPQNYQQQRYRSLDQARVNWREQRLLAQLLTQCQLAKGTVLDVPCGYSRLAPLYNRLGITALGADVSYDMAHLPAANHARHGWQRWLCADVLALPFIDGVFDGVLYSAGCTIATATLNDSVSSVNLPGCRVALSSSASIGPRCSIPWRAIGVVPAAAWR